MGLFTEKEAKKKLEKRRINLVKMDYEQLSFKTFTATDELSRQLKCIVRCH